MNLFQGIILGIIQGLTEFLPVSSSGHLVLFQNAMGLKSADMMFFNVMVHVGTLVAIFVVFWKDIPDLLRHPVQKLMGLLIVATLPAVAAQLLIGDFIEESLGGNTWALAFCLRRYFSRFPKCWRTAAQQEEGDQLSQCPGHWLHAGHRRFPGRFPQRFYAGRWAAFGN